MPQRETRHSIERALAKQRRTSRAVGLDQQQKMRARLEAQMARLRDKLDPAEFARLHATYERFASKVSVQIRRKRRPGEGSMPAFVEPPRGPRPLSGGAAAALEFDD